MGIRPEDDLGIPYCPKCLLDEAEGRTVRPLTLTGIWEREDAAACEIHGEMAVDEIFAIRADLRRRGIPLKILVIGVQSPQPDESSSGT